MNSKNHLLIVINNPINNNIDGRILVGTRHSMDLSLNENVVVKSTSKQNNFIIH